MEDQDNNFVTELIRIYVTNQLQAYQGNLEFATQIIRNGWLPAEDDPAIRPHLLTLQQHLAKTGRQEKDSFLLRLGLTVPGHFRGIVPPCLVLDASRGGFSKKRHGEAEGQIRRLQEALVLGRRFVFGSNLDTQEAITKLSDLILSQDAQEDRILLRYYRDITPRCAKLIEKQAIIFLESEETSIYEMGTEILQHLACFSGTALSESCCHTLIEKRIFWPPSMFRDSGDSVALQLIALLEKTSETITLHHLLLALAWTRSLTGQKAFQQWRDQLPAWLSNLSEPLDGYPRAAGWSLEENDPRRDLISTECIRLVLATEVTHKSIPCRKSVNESCPSCGGPLSWLFDFSQIARDFFPKDLFDAPRKVLCCLHCACYEPVYTTYRADGTSSWISPHKADAMDFAGDIQECVRQLDDSPCPPFACAEPFSLDDASTLGGIPMWLQNSAYPQCIECEKPMTFLAQHDNGPLGDEGIYYAFFCSTCRVASVTYQQT